MADLRYDPIAHKTTLPDGTDVPHVTHILSAVGLTTDFDELADRIGPRRAQAIDYARERGTAVHADCHAYDDEDLLWSTVDAGVRPYVEAWAQLREDKCLVPLRRERQIFHPVYCYTGFLDGVFRVDKPGENKRPLIDIKTGDPEDAFALAQLAAYHAADSLAHPDPTERATERWAVWLLPRQNPPYKVYNYSARPEAALDFSVFAAALTVYRNQPGRRLKVAV